MTPAQRLQAAIEKLERLKAESTPGPWFKDNGEFYGIVWTQETEADTTDPTGMTPMPVQFEVAHTARSVDGDLIEVLHRTIDEQLVILAGARDALSMTFAGMVPRPETYEHEIALADAILGEAS